MDEQKLEKDIEHIAINSLRALKTIFLGQRLNDREASLALAFYLKLFCQHGYIGNKPADVLRNAAEITEQVGGNVALNLEHQHQ